MIYELRICEIIYISSLSLCKQYLYIDHYPEKMNGNNQTIIVFWMKQYNNTWVYDDNKEGCFISPWDIIEVLNRNEILINPKYKLLSYFFQYPCLNTLLALSEQIYTLNDLILSINNLHDEELIIVL